MTTVPEMPESFKHVFWTFGDANLDGIIDEVDLAYVKSKMGSSDKDADFNGDGKVDILDISICAKHQGYRIEELWQSVAYKEELEQKLSVITGLPNLPWYVDYAKHYAELQGGRDEAWAAWLTPTLQSFKDNLTALGNLPSTLPAALAEELKTVAGSDYETGLERLTYIHQKLKEMGLIGK